MLGTPEKLATTIEMVSPNVTDKVAIMEGFSGVKDISRRFSDGLVRVTDLLNPKRAYFNERYPELVRGIPFERRELMWAGLDFHEEFGYAVSQREYCEQFVGVEGIMGRIDIFKDHPVEVKRTKDIDAETDVVCSRPDNVEQLGMYCSMTNVSWGRLVFFIYKGEEPGTVFAFKVEFDDLKAIRQIMRERKKLLLDAWNSSDTSQLPSCPWFKKGCEAEKRCDCANSRPFGHEIAAHVSACVYEPEESRRLTRQLNAYILAPKSRITYWNLLFPRKFWFRRSEQSRETDEDEPKTVASERLAWQNVKRGVETQIKHSPNVDFKREYVEFEEEKIPVESLRNVPTVITFPRGTEPIPPESDRIARFFRDDVMRLGMQCALVGKKTGKLIAYHQNAKDSGSKLMVYMVHFKDVELYRQFMKERLGALRDSIEHNDLKKLPKCPEVKCRYKDWQCPHFDECGPNR